MPYENVQFIGINVPTGPIARQYVGLLDENLDMGVRLKIMRDAIRLAYITAANDRKCLKVFMAPEFFWRGKEGAYKALKITQLECVFQGIVTAHFKSM